MAYVYLHTKPNGEIFYVGKGNGKRAYDKTNRNKHWKRVVNKYGYNVSVFLDNISDDKAFSVEMDLIDAIGLDNLTNLTKGGEGVRGNVLSEDSKLKLSKSQKDRIKKIRGTEKEKLWKKRLSAKKTKKNHPNYGGVSYFKNHSEETKNHLCKIRSSKVFSEYDNLLFNSVKETAKHYNCSVGHINNMIKGYRENKYNLIRL